MNFGRLKRGAEYVGGIAVATSFVVLLSFIFSFLGTIFCAALGGMMLGALRTHKWHAVPISCVFPLVFVGLMQVMKTELTNRQIFWVAVVCLCVFWVAYVTAMALFVLERPSPGQASSQSQTNNGGSAASQDAAPSAPALTPAPSAREVALSLELLQGIWCPEVNGNGAFEKRLLSIENDELTVSLVDSNGGKRVLARAAIKVCTGELGSTLVVAAESLRAEAGTERWVAEKN